MIKIHRILAEADLLDTLTGSIHTAHSGFRDMAVVLGSLFGISLVIAVWLVFFRGKPRVRKYRHHHHHRPIVLTEGQTGESPPAVEEVKARRKWKRPRRPHRPRNPTLAETGGLPPARDGQTPPPSLP